MFLERELKRYCELGARPEAFGGYVGAVPTTQSTQGTAPIELGPFRFVDLLNTWDLYENTPLYLLVSDGDRQAVAVAARSVYEPFKAQIDPQYPTGRMLLIRHLGFVPWRRELIPQELADFITTVNGCEAVLKVSVMQLRGGSWLSKTTGPRPPRRDELGPLPSKQHASPFRLPLTFEAERPDQFAPVQYSDVDSYDLSLSSSSDSERPVKTVNAELFVDQLKEQGKPGHRRDIDRVGPNEEGMNSIGPESENNNGSESRHLSKKFRFDSEANLEQLISYGARQAMTAQQAQQQLTVRPEILPQAPSQPWPASQASQASQGSEEPKVIALEASEMSGVSQAFVASEASQALELSEASEALEMSEASQASETSEASEASKMSEASEASGAPQASQASRLFLHATETQPGQVVDDSQGPLSAVASSETWMPSTNDEDAWTETEEQALIFAIVYAHGANWDKVLELYGEHGSMGDALKRKSLRQMRSKASNLKHDLVKSGKTLPPGFEFVPLYPEDSQAEADRLGDGELTGLSAVLYESPHEPLLNLGSSSSALFASHSSVKPQPRTAAGSPRAAESPPGLAPQAQAQTQMEMQPPANLLSSQSARASWPSTSSSSASSSSFSPSPSPISSQPPSQVTSTSRSNDATSPSRIVSSSQSLGHSGVFSQDADQQRADQQGAERSDLGGRDTDSESSAVANESGELELRPSQEAPEQDHAASQPGSEILSNESRSCRVM